MSSASPIRPVAFLRSCRAASRFALLVAAVCAASNSPIAGAEKPADASRPANAVEIDEVSVGLRGAFKVGRWTRAAVRIKAPAPAGARLEVEAVDPDGGVTRHVSEGPLQTGRELSTPFQFGRLEGTLRLKVVADGRTLAERRIVYERNSDDPDRPAPPLPQSVVLTATLGRSTGLTSDPERGGSADAPRLRVAELQSPADLPDEAPLLDGLDCLLLSGHPDLTERQLRAVRTWVTGGGHLVLCIGRDAETLKEPSKNPWASFGVSFAGMSRPRELSGLRGFVGTAVPLAIPQDALAAKFSAIDGVVRLSALDGPLLVEAPLGFGRVTVLGVNLPEWRQGTFVWPPLADLLRKLIVGAAPAAVSTQPRQAGQIARQGTTDLSTQLRGRQDEFPNVSRPTAWTALGLLAVYIVLIGPADYFLVHRVLRRPSLTWISLAVVAAGATAGAAWLATTSNGRSLRLNQVDVVDVDLSTGEARARSLFTVYSPESQRYDVEVEPAAWIGPRTLAAQAARSVSSPAPAAWLCWDGVPEETFGGMYRAAGLGLQRAEYSIDGPAGRVALLPIAEWGARDLVAEWRAETEGLLACDLESPGVSQLAGTLTHRLPGPITGWVLAFGNRVYLPRPSASGETSSIRSGVPWSPVRTDVLQRELNGFLTGATATRVKARDKAREDDIRVEQRYWDPFGVEMAEVVRMITFHDKADGPLYTGLANHGLRRLELSHLLDLRRAVLFGRIDAPASSLAVTGADPEAPQPSGRRTAFVRLVFPVKTTGSVPRELRDFSDKPIPPPDRPLKLPADAPAEAEVPADAPSRETTNP